MMAVSQELELELKLNKLNSKIIFYDKLARWMKIPFIKYRVYVKMDRVIRERDECFKRLRDLLRKKYPDKFIRSEQ